MHPFEIREKRFRLQKAAAKLEEGADTTALEQQVVALQELCEHPNFDEDPDKGWRCRDCDLTRPPEPQEEPEVEAVEAPVEQTATTASPQA